MKHRCFSLQKKFDAFHEEVKLANYLQEEEKIHDSSSTLVARVTKLEDTLKVVEKRYQDASVVVKENTLQTEEVRKTLLQEAEAHAEALKALEDKFFDMMHALYESLQ